jgi:hypothetical protein
MMMKHWHLFRRQGLHLLWLLTLCAGLWLASFLHGFRVSHGWSVTIGQAAAVSVALGALHHLWVLVFWRLELRSKTISRRLGKAGFPIFSIGFVILIGARFVSVAYLAILNGGTLALALSARLILVGIIGVLNVWGIYSVLRYFGIRRAFGLDHFDRSVARKGLVRGGAYRYMKNVMYLIILPAFCVPGLLWGSLASTLVGVFHWLFVWAHYYCTELPDMAEIYGRPASGEG